MREPVLKTRDMLFRIEDYSILMQALGLGHKIIINNGFADLEVYMDEDLNIKALNMNFPDLPPYNYNEEMSLKNVILGVIPQLEKQPASAEFSGGFTSRWAELKTITNDTVGFNRFKEKEN